MTNEIKELLDNINDKYNDYYVHDIVSGEDLKLLSDYITNLEMENKELEIKYSVLKKESEMYENELFRVGQKYKLRNKKATNYVKNTNFWGIYEDTPMSEVKYGEELLEILEGEKDGK